MNEDMKHAHALKEESFEEEFSTGENFSELLKASESSEVKEGTLVKGKVVAIENGYIIAELGLKTEGRVPAKEFIKDGKQQDPEIGQEIEVYLEKIENKDGEAVISYEKAIRELSWKEFEKANAEGSTVEGTIFGRVKGGFTVDLDGAIAFLPGSQVDVRPVKDISPLMGIKQPFQILKMDRKRGNIVVSRRAILEESRSVERDEVLSQINEGDTVEGTVKNITDYGAFVDLGAVDGLLHVTDISWTRISHPSEVLKVGETIKAKVIKFDEDSKRISLGMKQLEDSPWARIEEKYPLNGKAKGRITNITDYGAFVELESGVEGLVHVSEMSWSKKNQHPNKLVKLGDEVEVMLLDIDPVKHRISLGIKQCQDNPWDSFSEKHPDGEKIKGKIKNITEFGIFVEIDGGVDGLVHVSDLSWTESAEEEVKKYNKGDEIEVLILGVDTDNERVSLGIKQLEEDPFLELTKGMKKNQISTFEVCDVKEDGIEVKITEGLTSFIKKSELAKDKVEQRPDRFAVGDRVDAKVIVIDNKTRKVSLSIKALEAAEHKKALKEYGSADSGASLGDILGAALDNSGSEEKAEEKEEKKAKKETKSKAKKEDKEEASDSEDKKPAKKKPAAKKPKKDEESKE